MSQWLEREGEGGFGSGHQSRNERRVNGEMKLWVRVVE